MSHSEPRERPGIARAQQVWHHRSTTEVLKTSSLCVQVVGRLELYLEDTRAVAATASRCPLLEVTVR